MATMEALPHSVPHTQGPTARDRLEAASETHVAVVPVVLRLARSHRLTKKALAHRRRRGKSVPQGSWAAAKTNASIWLKQADTPYKSGAKYHLDSWAKKWPSLRTVKSGHASQVYWQQCAPSTAEAVWRAGST
eukprot:365707-Chlamydomonas_euryale.AAC.37